MYAVDVGFWILDIVDFYLVNFALLIIAFLECVAVGWIWNAKK